MEHVDLIQISKKEADTVRNYDNENVSIMRILDSLNLGVAAFNQSGMMCGSNRVMHNFAKFSECNEEVSEEINFDSKLDLENKILNDVLLTRGVSSYSSMQEDIIKSFTENLLSNFIELKDTFQNDLFYKDKKDSLSQIYLNRTQSFKKRKKNIEIPEFIDMFKNILIGEEFIMIGVSKVQGNSTSKFYEVKARMNISSCENISNICEFLIVDVTKIKEAEIIKEAMKYKSLGLAKVAHDFKHVIGAIIGILQEIEINSPEKFENCKENLENKVDSLNDEYTNENSHSANDSPSRRKVDKSKTHKPDQYVLSKFQINNGNISKKNIIQNFCNYASVLIQDFSTYANTDIEKVVLKQGTSSEKFQVKEVEILPILEFCMNIFKIKQKYERKENIKLVLDLEPNLPKYILANEFKLKQVLVNLISNAYKFTLEGTITVSAAAVNKGVRISVSDSGIGMSLQEQQMLFSPFSKLDSGRNYNVCGTGLGLMIIKETLLKMGSKIEFKSEKGKGSTFWFDIPTEYHSASSNFFSRKSESEEVSFVDQSCVYTESLINMILNFNDGISNTNNKVEEEELGSNLLNTIIIEKKDEDTNWPDENIINHNTLEGIKYVHRVMRRFSSNKVVSKMPSSKSIGQKSLKKYSILICDDDKHIAVWTRNLLNEVLLENKIDSEIHLAEDAMSCLNIIYNERKKNRFFDLLITDESMPFLKGSRLVKLVRSLIEDKEIVPMSIYISSSYDDPNIYDQFKQSGCNGLLNKPVSKDAITHMLKDIKFIFNF